MVKVCTKRSAFLPDDEAILPIYNDLYKRAKCLHRRTQNPNGIIWNRLPKANHLGLY